jgi:hypothetical protein
MTWRRGIVSAKKTGLLTTSPFVSRPVLSSR